VTRPLFEQYKDALRRGHLAARGGRLDDAIAAYAEAARLAPDRAAPHASSATVLHRAGRDGEALEAFELALRVAPDDDATLRARAAVYREMGRLASAAADLERVAETLAADRRRDDALKAAREALDLTATPARRALVERLEGDEDAAARPRPAITERRTPAAAAAAPKPAPSPAKTSAPALAPEPAPEPAAGPVAAGSSSTLMDLYDEPIEDAPADERPIDRAAAIAGAPIDAPTAVEPVAEAPVQVPEGDDSAPRPLVPELAVLNAQTPGRISLDPSVRDPGLEGLVVLEPDADPADAIPWPAIDLPSAPPPPIVGPPPDPEVLMAQSLALIDSGDPKAARNLMLTAVMVHRAAGRPDAALDVCLQLLALFPGDAHVHLAIAGLQLDHGWQVLATEKIQLLLRLTALTGDTQAEADAHALAAERLRDDALSSFARA